MPLDDTTPNPSSYDYGLPEAAIGGYAGPSALPPTPPPPPPNPTPYDTSAQPAAGVKQDGSSSLPDEGPVMQPGQWAQPPEVAKPPPIPVSPPMDTADSADVTPPPPSTTPPVLKGAAGGNINALGGPDYQDHEVRLQMPVGRYKQLEQDQPTLFQAINSVASDVGVPPLDLAALVYANSGNDPQARKGNRVGYMGLTPEDMKKYDPDGHMDPSNPIQNLYVGAEKYRQLSMEFGRGTPQVFAAYYTNPMITTGIQSRHPADHQQAAPHGTFDFINRVIGHDQGPQTAESADTQAQAPPGQVAPPSAAADYPPDTWGMDTTLSDQDRLARGLPLSRDRGAPLYNAPEPPPARTGWDRPLGQVLLDPATWRGAGQPYNPYANVQPTTTSASTFVPPPPLTGQGGVLQPAPPPAAALPPPAVPAATPAAPPPPGPTGTMAIGGAGQIAPPPPQTPMDVSKIPIPSAAGLSPSQAGAPLPAPAPAVAMPEATTPTPARQPGVTATPEAATAGGGATAPPSTAPPPAPPAAPTHAMERPGTAPLSNRVAFGDSYAEAAINQARLGGTIAPIGTPDAAGTARDGASTGEVLRRINAADPSLINGKDVTLSTGILNGGSMQDVKSQIDALIAKGARSVMVLGTPTSQKYNEYNGMLKGIVDAYDDDENTQNKVNFAGGVEQYARDGLHPDNMPAYLGVTTGSGAGPVVAKLPGAGQPAAAIGAGERVPDRDMRGPITSLPTGSSQMTPRGMVRADVQGGPNGVLTWLSQNHAPGATMGQAWDYAQNMMAQWAAYKGDPVAGMHAQEWLFRLQHQGAIENAMQAYNAFQHGDLVGAGQLLARSHSFFNDGAAVGFQINNGQLWGQRYSEDTHQPIGQPFQVTGPGILAMVNQTTDPQTFLEMADKERRTNEEISHNMALEEHGQQALQTQRDIAGMQAQSRANLVQYAQDQAWQRAELRARTQEGIAANRLAAQRKDYSDAYGRQVNTDADNLYGPGAVNPPIDINGQQFNDDARNAAQTLYKNMRLYNPNLGSLMAQDLVRNLLAGRDPNSKYRFQPTAGGGGNDTWLGVIDRRGNDLHVYIPQRSVQSILPGRVPAPQQQQQPQVRPAAQVQ